MQRWIERTDDYRESVHRFEQAGKIVALHGQQFLQSFLAGWFVVRQNHGLHVWDAIRGEKHVLRAAQANAFRAERARSLGIAWNIGIGANAEVAPKFVGP